MSFITRRLITSKNRNNLTIDVKIWIKNDVNTSNAISLDVASSATFHMSLLSKTIIFFGILFYLIKWKENTVNTLSPLKIKHEEYQSILENVDRTNPLEYELDLTDLSELDDSICIVSKLDYSIHGNYYKLQETIFDELNPGMTTKYDMFNLPCTHLLYLGHLMLISDPAQLLNADYKKFGMTLFGSVKDGFLINIKRFKIKYTQDTTLQRIFSNMVDQVVVFGNDIIGSFCGELLGFGLDYPVLVFEKHPYISRKYNSYKKATLSDIFEDDLGCWDTDIPKIKLKNVLKIDPKPKKDCLHIKEELMNILPHPEEWEPKEEYINKAKHLLSIYMPQVKQRPIPEMGATKGVVMLIYGKVFNDTATNIRYMRQYLTKLPFEIMHNNELKDFQINELQDIKDVRVISISTTLKEHGMPIFEEHNYHFKFAALLRSTFRHVLFLDSDSMPMRDPSDIFNDYAYTSTGLLMFPDLSKTDPNNPIYKVVDFDCVDELEVESGQFLIDTYKHYHTILLSFYMLKDQDVWYKLFFGDKDVLKWSARYLRKPIHVEQTFMKSLGFKLQEYRCGQTMIHSLNGIMSFFHMNLLKHNPELHEWQLSGYQEYTDLSKVEARFYFLNEWQCVTYDDSDWQEDMTPFQPFLADYLHFRQIG